MSIFEIIFQQKIILISIIVALVPLLAALALFILPRMRRAIAQRKARAAERAAQRAAEQAEKQAMMAASGHTSRKKRRSAAPGQQPATPGEPVTPGQPAMPGQPPEITAPAANGPPEPGTASTTTPETPATPEQQSGQPPAADSGLQDLLSVFGEAEDNGDRAILLEGLDPVDVTQLAALSHDVAEQLRAQAR